MSLKICCSIALILGCALHMQAQQQWLFSHLGKKEGLASDMVYGVQQDRKGYIWIATSSGLERYDGQRFVLFRHKPGDPTTIPNDKIRQPLLDKKNNRLWLLFEYNSVGYMDLDDLHFHQVSVRIKEEELKKADAQLFLNVDEQLIMLVKRHGAFGYDPKAIEFSWSASPFPTPASWNPLCVTQDSLQHNYWIGCDSGLVKYDPISKKLSYRGHNADNDPIIAHYAAMRDVSLPYLDKSGRFWLETWPNPGWYGLFSFDTHTGKETKWESALLSMLHYKYHDINYFGEHPDGTIWIGGTNLLVGLKKGSENFEVLESQLTGEFNLHYDVVYHLLEDRENNIWISTDKGLYRFNPHAQIFHTIASRRSDKDSIYTPDVTDLLELSNGDILVSTWGNGLFVYDSNFRPKEHPLTELSRHNRELMTWCIHQRPNGDLWRGEQDGRIIITHAATRETESFVLPIFRNSTIRQITEDKKGDLWMGTQKGDLIRWQASGNTYSLVSNLGSSIQRLYADRQGEIWACTTKTGLYQINTTDGRVIYHYSTEGAEGQRLSSIGVPDILQYSDSLFVVASGGLHVLNEYTHRIHFIEPINGVPDNTVSNLVMDKKGYVWASTLRGICKINVRNEARSIFNEVDGVGTNTFNEGSGTLLKDGRIALGTAHDLMIWQPSDILSENLQPPDAEITNFSLMNKWLSTDSLSKLDRIELPYDQNAIRIVFSTLTFQNTFGIFYKLEGLDKDWVLSESNEAIYNWLPPGQYTFMVEARNSEGVISLHRKQIKIIVEAPFWRTWGFYAFVALALAALLYWFDRQRTQRKEGLQKIRTNISDNLHVEIHTALQHINVLSEIARIKAEKSPEQSVNYINEIHHKSRSMIIALEDMLWSIDPANDNMQKAAARMKEFAEALCQQTGARIEFQEDDRILELRPDMKIRHELMLVYKLSLRLLVEEMRAKHTIVQLDFERSQLMLSLFAAGIRPDNNNHSMKMLEEMKSRAQSIKGTLDLQFDDKGAAIIFICPSIS